MPMSVHLSQWIDSFPRAVRAVPSMSSVMDYDLDSQYLPGPYRELRVTGIFKVH